MRDQQPLSHTHTTELLDANFLESLLRQALPHKPFVLDVLPTVDSTNRYLLEKNSDDLHICLAEQQTAGRGRQGKTWASPFGINLYCSVLWPFTKNITQLAGLSLTLGVVVANTLEEYGVSSVGLKWPNDIFCENKKIAGILVEVVSEHTHFHKVVMGIGLNIALSKTFDATTFTIDQPWTDVASQVAFKPSRNELTLQLLKNVLHTLPLFEQTGFSAFQQDWLNKDILLNQSISVKTQKTAIDGIVRGIDEGGHLIVETPEGLRYFSSADVSINHPRST